MHDEFGADQQRHDDQEADVYFDVPDKRDGKAAVQQLPLCGRQDEEWNPATRYGENDSAMKQSQRVVGEMPPPEQLEKRSTKSQRKVLLPGMFSSAIRNFRTGHSGSNLQITR